MIEDRNLEVGTRLVAKYKKQTYVCRVEAGENGEGIAFVFENGNRYKSPSAAATAITSVAQNGWLWWSREGASPANSIEVKAKPAKVKSSKGRKAIYRIPNQRNVPAGKTRFFCVRCKQGFVVDGTDAPSACPEGHATKDLDAEPVVG